MTTHSATRLVAAALITGGVGISVATPARAAACDSALTFLNGNEASYKLASDVKAHLKKIAKTFCTKQTAANRNRKSVVVTSGTRGAGKQAGLMMTCLKNNNCPHANKEAVKELKAVYDGKKTQTAVTNKIKEQVGRNCFVSKHLSNRGVDIDRFENKELKDCDKYGKDDQTLYEILTKYSYKSGGQIYKVHIITDEGKKCTHFHLNFKPYGYDIRKCPKAN